MSFKKSMVHSTTFETVKSIAAVDNLVFKRLDIGGVQRDDKSSFYSVKTAKGDDIFWLFKVDERAGFSRGYVNIIKKGGDAAKKQEAMCVAWKKVRKSLAARKKEAVLVDADLPMSDNPFPLVAKLMTIDKAPVVNTVLGSLVLAVDNAFRVKQGHMHENLESHEYDEDYNSQYEMSIPHKVLWEYLYSQPCPTGDHPDLMQVLTADLKDAYIVLKLTGVNVKLNKDEGDIRNIAKTCLKVHHIYEIPNLGVMKKANKSPASEIGSSMDFASLLGEGVSLESLFEASISCDTVKHTSVAGGGSSSKKADVPKARRERKQKEPKKESAAKGKKGKAPTIVVPIDPPKSVIDIDEEEEEEEEEEDGENMYDRRGPDGKLKDHSLLPENENEEEEEDDAGEAEPQATTLPVEDSVTKARKKLRAV